MQKEQAEMLLHDQVELAHNLISIHAHVLGSNNIFSSIDVESGVLFLVLMFLFFNISRVCSALWQNGATFLFHFGQYAESVPPKWKQSLENIGIGEPLVIYIQASKDFGMFDPFQALAPYFFKMSFPLRGCWRIS